MTYNVFCGTLNLAQFNSYSVLYIQVPSVDRGQSHRVVIGQDAAKMHGKWSPYLQLGVYDGLL